MVSHLPDLELVIFRRPELDIADRIWRAPDEGRNIVFVLAMRQHGRFQQGPNVSNPVSPFASGLGEKVTPGVRTSIFARMADHENIRDG